MEKKNQAVVTVVGRDTIGIIARVSRELALHDANILDISQTVLSGLFNMIMIVDISLAAKSLMPCIGSERRKKPADKGKGKAALCPGTMEEQR